MRVDELRRGRARRGLLSADAAPDAGAAQRRSDGASDDGRDGRADPRAVDRRAGSRAHVFAGAVTGARKSDAAADARAFSSATTAPTTPAPTPTQTAVQITSSVTLEGIVATEFNSDEGLKAAFAQSIIDSSDGVFDDVVDVEAAERRRLADGAGVEISYTGVTRVDGTDNAEQVSAELLEQSMDALTLAIDDGSFLTTLQASDPAFSAVAVDVDATTRRSRRRHIRSSS